MIAIINVEPEADGFRVSETAILVEKSLFALVKAALAKLPNEQLQFLKCDTIPRVQRERTMTTDTLKKLPKI